MSHSLSISLYCYTKVIPPSDDTLQQHFSAVVVLPFLPPALSDSSYFPTFPSTIRQAEGYATF